jgi:hypothetical protein
MNDSFVRKTLPQSWTNFLCSPGPASVNVTKNGPMTSNCLESLAIKDLIIKESAKMRRLSYKEAYKSRVNAAQKKWRGVKPCVHSEESLWTELA